MIAFGVDRRGRPLLPPGKTPRPFPSLVHDAPAAGYLVARIATPPAVTSDRLSGSAPPRRPTASRRAIRTVGRWVQPQPSSRYPATQRACQTSFPRTAGPAIRNGTLHVAKDHMCRWSDRMWGCARSACRLYRDVFFGRCGLGHRHRDAQDALVVGGCDVVIAGAGRQGDRTDKTSRRKTPSGPWTRFLAALGPNRQLAVVHGDVDVGLDQVREAQPAPHNDRLR